MHDLYRNLQTLYIYKMQILTNTLDIIIYNIGKLFINKTGSNFQDSSKKKEKKKDRGKLFMDHYVYCLVNFHVII